MASEGEGALAKPVDELPPAVRVLEITHTAFVACRVLYVIAKLGIADLLRQGARSSEELARATGTHARSLYRVLRAAASVGVVSESQDHRFALTDVGSTLRSDVPDSLRGWVLYTGEPWNLQAWQELLHSVRTGEPAWERAHGVPFFEYFSRHPDASEIFDAAMTDISRWDGAVVAAAYDFSQFRTVLDVGGGQGALLVSILKANAGVRGVLYDQAHVVERARDRIAAEGLEGRCEIVIGSFFESVPGGADAYVLKYIIHDWQDDRAHVILANCRRAMTSAGKLLLIELIVPPPGESHLAKTSDVEMLVMLGSPERTINEYESLLNRAGFRLARVVRTPEVMSIIEATPV
jgi:hypothetical protein